MTASSCTAAFAVGVVAHYALDLVVVGAAALFGWKLLGRHRCGNHGGKSHG